MALSNYYSCEEQLPDHFCDPCPSGSAGREYARVRSMAAIFKDYLADLMVDPTNVQKWLDGIEAGQIIIIPETSGSFDPGTPKELKGYGDRKSSYGPREQKLIIDDPNYKDNYAFMNALPDITQLVFAFRTSSVINIADVPASAFASNPVADDLEAEVTWQIEAKWISRNLPTIHDASTLGDIFKCF